MDTISGTAAGLIGGLVGTTMMAKGVSAVAGKLPERIRPTMPNRDAGDFMVSNAERIAGKPLPQKAHSVASQALHYAYGTTFPTLLGLAAPRFTRWQEPLAAGAALGAFVWAISYAGWLPATGLTPPVHRQGALHATPSLLTHVLYGVVSALPLAALMAVEGRRERGARRWIRRIAKRFGR
jgi:hypothetical protein